MRDRRWTAAKSALPASYYRRAGEKSFPTSRPKGRPGLSQPCIYEITVYVWDNSIARVRREKGPRKSVRRNLSE